MTADIKLKGLSSQQVENLLPEGLISLCWRGSVAHGMYVPKSDPDSIDDKDVMGVYIGAREHLGFGRRDVSEKWEGEWDCVFYELRKFIVLLLNCNPNVSSLLWLEPNQVIYENPLGQRLRANRDIFVSKKAYHSFSGYAHDQFKRMVSFNQEAQALMAQLEEQLTSFGIDPDSTDDGHSLKRLDGQPFVGATMEMMEVVKRYRGERRRYYSGGYMGQKRRELVRRVGYDAKNASHLIRLLRMGIEFLTEALFMLSAPMPQSFSTLNAAPGPSKKSKRKRSDFSNWPRKPTSSPLFRLNPIAHVLSACVWR